MYASFAAPLADITRVLNYRGDIGSVRESINAAFTNHTVKYIDNFLTDLNGGAITPVGQGMIDKMLGGAKRGAVAANLSVAIQQASAGVRAKAEIDAKYFLPAQVSGLRYRRAYAELLKYSPTAQLKQWGYFDTSMTRTIYQRAKGGVMQSIQDKASWMAQQGDMLNWAQIWEAVKNEQRDITGLEGEELLQTAAKRFREVIDKTQVVDSVFHRSEWARSKGAAKLLTSFMSEPIQMYNMLYRAKVMASNGDNGTAAKYVGSVAASMVLNAALSAVVGALRDRDNDKRDAKHNIIGVRGFSDKYTDAFLDRLVSAPFSLLPFVSDAYDMWKGYDATNLFMLPIQKVINAERGIEGLITGKTDWWTALKKTLDAGSMATGIPVYNVIRDAESLINTGIETVKRDTLLGMAYDTTQPISVRLAAARANVDPAKKPGLYYDMLTVATMGGQENEQEAIRAVLKETGRTDSTIDSTIQGRVREAEPLVQAAAKVVVANDVRGQKAVIDALVNAGYEKEMSVAMVRSEANYIENQAAKLAGLEGAEREKFLKDSRYDEAYLKGVELPKESEEGEGNAPSMYRYSALMNAIQSGNDSDIMTVMKQFQSEGKSLSTIKAQVTGYFKPIYYAAHVRGDEAAKKSIRDMLTKYFDYKVGKVNVFTNKRETNDFDNWLEESYKKDMWTAIENGDADTLAAIRKDMQKYMSFSESREAIKKKYAKEYFTLSADEQAAVRKALTGIGISEELIARWARASK
jgi:ribosomal protein L23